MPPMPTDNAQETDAMPPALPQYEPEAPEGMEPTEGEFCLPLDALGQPDEQDKMETPGVGDKGQANIEWTINRVEGVNAYVTIDAVNGKTLDKPEAGPSDDQQMGELQQMAANMPPRQ